MAPPQGAFAQVYVPLLNIPQTAIRLRPEFSVVCAYAGISTSQLLTVDDIDTKPLNPSDTRWILVDHNKLQGKLGEFFSRRVHGVIDHHDEEHAVPPDTGVEPRIVQKAGSCTSLVVSFCRSSWDVMASTSIASGAGHGQGEHAINDAAVTQTWDAQIAKMAMASILIDTANLTAPGKVEQLDRDAVRYLEAKINLSPKDARSWDRTQFYESINQAKQDIGGLTLDEVLIKDYKEWNEQDRKLGITSVVKPLGFLVEKAAHQKPFTTFDQAVSGFAKDRDLAVFAIMTSFKAQGGGFQRQLLVLDNITGHTAASKFYRLGTQELVLEELSLDISKQTDFSSTAPWVNFWIQRDITKSRKQVAPLLREAMTGQ